MFLSNNRLPYSAVSRASSATDMRPVSARRKSKVSTVAAPLSCRSASIGFRACSRASSSSEPMWRHSTCLPKSRAALSIRCCPCSVQRRPLLAATAVTVGIAPSLTNDRTSSIRSFRRLFSCTGSEGSKSAPMAAIMPATPFSGNAATPRRFALYLPCIRVTWSSPSSGGSKYRASIPKSLPPSTMPSSVCSSVRSKAVLATRNTNAAERRAASSAPSPSSSAKTSPCLSRMPVTCWSMICSARGMPYCPRAGDPAQTAPLPPGRAVRALPRGTVVSDHWGFGGT